MEYSKLLNAKQLDNFSNRNCIQSGMAYDEYNFVYCIIRAIFPQEAKVNYYSLQRYFLGEG